MKNFMHSFNNAAHKTALALITTGGLVLFGVGIHQSGQSHRALYEFNDACKIENAGVTAHTVNQKIQQPDYIPTSADQKVLSDAKKATKMQKDVADYRNMGGFGLILAAISFSQLIEKKKKPTQPTL